MRNRIFVTFVFMTVSLTLATAARAQFSVDANTVALWHFDDGSGTTAIDAGPNGFDLALDHYDGSHGDSLPSWTQLGCFGEALHFAIGDLSTYGGFASFQQSFSFAQNQLTTEMWLSSTASNPGYLLVLGFVQYAIYVQDDGTLYMNAGDGNNWSNPVISTGVVNDGLWHYVATTYDGANVRVFIDGQPDGSVAFSGTVGTISAPVYVGGRPSNDFFAGTIDEVRISNVARSANEISNNWNQLSVLCPEPERVEASGAALVMLLLLHRRRTSLQRA